MKFMTTRRRGYYPPSLKRQLAQYYRNGEFPYGTNADKYGLDSMKVVKEFVRGYKVTVYAQVVASSATPHDHGPRNAPFG